MRLLLTILLLSLTTVAQTRSDLERKYTAIGENIYRVRAGVAVEVTYSEDGKPATFKIVPEDRENKKARLNIDEVRAVIWELVPGMICHRAQALTEIKVSCPPKNNCRGVQEKWDRGTTLMVTDSRKGVVYNLITLGKNVTPPPGGLILLPGYQHTSGCGIDTATGTIEKENGLFIRYDIGVLTDNFAAREVNRNVQWYRNEKVGDATVLIVLTRENKIIASFDNPKANFWSLAADQSSIDDFLKMILTYRGTIISDGR